jgi:hypothetical protein
MKKILFVIAGLIVALAVACSAVPTVATKAPTETPVLQTEVPTPRPAAEWALEEISVNKDTVIVSLFLHPTAAVTVKLDDKPPTRFDDAVVPVLNYVFEAVPAGQHDIRIEDDIGNVETTSVLVDWTKPSEDIAPDWLTKWLTNLEAEALDNPPKSITKYQSQGETVYYVVMECCDQFSDLLDADGELIGHPDGGITGRGDGVTVFDPTNLKGEEVWLAP